MVRLHMNAADTVFAGLAGQAELVASGEATPRELVEASLARIAALDPQLNAFRVVLEDAALTEADALSPGDASSDRPLLGVPIAIKDDHDVAGQVTAHGSNAAGAPAVADSELVRRLRAAGAIVVGKTHVPELEIWPWTETHTFGTTRNPWDPQRLPGGSSGGAASAVASGMVPASTASDGMGSIRIPAACCGLYGLKPTIDRVSPAPKASPWQGLSVWGALTRSVRDTALFLDAVADRVPAEPFAAATAREPGRLRVALSLKIPPGLVARLDPEIVRATQDAAELLRSLRHEVVERDPDYGVATIQNALARYLGGIADDAAAMAHPERLERRTRDMARLGRLGRPLLARSRAGEPAIRARLAALWQDVDVLLTPALATPPLPIGRYQGRATLTAFLGAGAFVPFQAPWNVTGQPACTIPVGQTASGLPLSVQLVGRHDDEATLLSLSAQMETARPWAHRRPPIS